MYCCSIHCNQRAPFGRLSAIAAEPRNNRRKGQVPKSISTISCISCVLLILRYVGFNSTCTCPGHARKVNDARYTLKQNCVVLSQQTSHVQVPVIHITEDCEIIYSSYWLHWSKFITTRKRSLGQDNVFTDVCLSTGRGLASQHGSQVTRLGGGSASGGVLGRPPTRYMGYYGMRSTSGRYASYWNAFLSKIYDIKTI